MSRKRPHRRGPVAPAGEPRPPRRRPPRVLWVTAALLAVIVLARSAVHRPSRHPASTGPDAAEPTTVAGMSGDNALRTAIALGTQGHDPASLPYFRHAIGHGWGDTWQVRYNYATALYNTTLRIETRNGLPVPAVRTSPERIALVRESIEQLTLAGNLARTTGDRATVQAAYAQLLTLWGLPWDAFVTDRRAACLVPTDRGLAARADDLVNLLRSPSTGAASPH
jgi:hypothetical protein